MTMGIYMSQYVADYLTLPLSIRYSPEDALRHMSELLFQEVNDIYDSVESTYDEVSHHFIAKEPGEQYILDLTGAIMCAPYDNPLSLDKLSEEIIEVFSQIYANLVLPDEIDLWADWDAELQMLNPDTAIVVFQEKDNVDILRGLLV